MYTEIITEYSHSQKHRHPLDNPTVTKRGVNPSCSDDIFLSLKIENDVIENISILGEGCAISQASASIMADLAEGKTVDEAKRLIKKFTGMIKKEVTDKNEPEELGDAAAFENISKMPARVKCAVLSWHTLEEAITILKLNIKQNKMPIRKASCLSYQFQAHASYKKGFFN